jgi:hypothetical protein
MTEKKAPQSARERSAAASKRAKKHPWHKWTEGEFQKRENLNARDWTFGGQKS